MGMYDSIYAELICPDCGIEDWQEIQTKRFECALMRYSVGDVLPEAPAGELWLEEAWFCDRCKQRRAGERRKKAKTQPVFVHLVDGFIVEVTRDRGADKPVELAQLVKVLQVSAKRGTEYRLELSSLYHFIKNTRYSLSKDNEESKPHRMHLPLTETELLDRVLKSLSKVLAASDKKEL